MNMNKLDNLSDTQENCYYKIWISYRVNASIKIKVEKEWERGKQEKEENEIEEKGK